MDRKIFEDTAKNIKWLTLGLNELTEERTSASLDERVNNQNGNCVTLIIQTVYGTSIL
jgi:hypothetical protein